VASFLKCGGDAPWSNAQKLYTTIDSIQHGTLLHQQLETIDFKDKIHYMPYQQFRSDGSRVWSNLMSADWAAKQVVSIFCTFILLVHYLSIIGSDHC